MENNYYINEIKTLTDKQVELRAKIFELEKRNKIAYNVVKDILEITLIEEPEMVNLIERLEIVLKALEYKGDEKDD